jgi:choline dehydrogenase-like flavoprotein
MSAGSDERGVVVIGSGPAGAAAAEMLIARNIPTTLLESGRAPQPKLHVRVARDDYLQRLPRPGAGLPYLALGDAGAAWHSALEPGGLSNYWSLQMVRLHADDFTEGRRLHERYEWPVRYEDLEPYYRRVEGYVGLLGAAEDAPGFPASRVRTARTLPDDWAPIARAASAAGQGFLHRSVVQSRAFDVALTGTAFNSYAHLIRRFSPAAPFRLVTGAHVSHLEWDGRRVTRAVYVDRETGATHAISARAFILAAGSLGTPRILLHSTSADFPHGLGNTDGVLGAYFHDHPKCGGTIRLNRALTRVRIGAFLVRPPVAESPPLLAAACTLQSVKFARGVLRGSPSIGKSNELVWWQFGTMVPTEENRVRLSADAKDPFGIPLLEVHMRFDDEVRPALARARERLLAHLDAAGLAPEVVAYRQDAPGASVHYGGAVRMHASPRYGMLDGQNRLHAVPNVLVVDASAWPTAAEKNPVLTIMAVASRAADRLANELRS